MLSMRFDKFISAMTLMAQKRNIESKDVHYKVNYNDEFNLIRISVSSKYNNRVGVVIMSQDEFNKNLETWSELEIGERLIEIALHKMMEGKK